MRIIVTGARAPVALELVRALGRAGHAAFAADSVPHTLAGPSRWAAGRLLLPPPRQDPAGFAAALGAAAGRLGADLIIPTCEEVFYLGAAHAALTARAALLCPPLADLALLHHKGRLQRHAAALGIPTPRTALLESRADLRAALAEFPRYLLKPAFSRFATRVISNCGPLAGRRSLDACDPTPQQPWLIQEFIAGEAECSYSLLHAGHVTAHCAYSTPATAGAGAGTAFAAVEGGPSLAAARALGAAAGLTGQLSLDFIRAPDGRRYLLECNPRATSGAHLIRPDQLVGGLLDPAQPTWVEPAGRRRQLGLAALPAALRGGPRALAAWLATPDVILSREDPGPALAQLPVVLQFLAAARRGGIGLLAATTADIEWNGEPPPAPSLA